MVSDEMKACGQIQDPYGKEFPELGDLWDVRAREGETQVTLRFLS